MAVMLPPSPEAKLVEGRDVIHTGSISSDVQLDLIRKEAHKVYHPSRIVRLWYWIAFQASFPYVANHYALEAARLRRIIVDLLTKVWFGHHLVARVLDVADLPAGGHDFVTRLVCGREPERTGPAKKFLRELDANFLEAGLPTWQTTPYNPHAITNFIEANDGTYRIIDLESSLVAFLYPVSRVVRLVRLGQFPSFDDIDIERLQAYVVDHAGEIHANLPPGEPELLDATIAAYATQQELWHRNERRWVPRALRLAFRLIDVPTWIRGAKRLTERSHDGAGAFVRDGIDEWVSEGRITQAQADRAREQLDTPRVTYAMLHLGGHFAISLALRFPLGSIARFGYTALLRLRAEVGALFRRGSVSSARETHTVLVALVALVPGLGSLAYLFSKPFRCNRLLIVVPFDRAAKKLPGQAYGRLHLRPLIDWWAGVADMASEDARGQGRHWQSIRPHVVPLTLLALMNVGVVAAGIYAYERLDGDWSWWFGERGLLDVVTAAQFILAATSAVLAYHYFWKSEEHRGPDAAGIFLWALAAIGLITFAVDDYFGVHEAIGEVIAGRFTDAGTMVTAAVFAAYVTLAATALYIFRQELFARRVSSLFLALAMAASAVAGAAAGLHDVGVVVPDVLSNPAIAAGMWLAAATTRLEEVLTPQRS